MRNKLNYLKIDLYWTKAHVGDVGNEEADEMAKEATTKVNIDTKFQNTRYQIRVQLDAKYKEIWNARWESSIKGRETWNYIKKTDYEKIYSDFYLNQVITGHGIFPKYQSEKF